MQRIPMAANLKGASSNTYSLNTRETIFRDRYNMFNDNYKKQVEKRLTEIYANANELKLDKQIDMTNNVYKSIVKKISRVYSSGVEREFSDTQMEELYQVNRIDKYLKQANKYTNAFNDVLLQVAWDSDNNKPHFIFRYPHKIKVDLDGAGNPKEVEYFVGQNEDNGEKWAYWSKEEHYYKIYSSNGDFKKEAIDGNSGMINPYYTLPFVFFQNGFRDSDFFDMYSGNDLVEVTLDTAVYNTFKNYMIKWQSFKQIIVQGTNVGQLDGQILDPANALVAEGNDVSIDVIDLQANLKELRETIDAQMVNVALNYNISPNQFRMTGDVSSGFALQMENEALDSFTKEQQQDFIEYERELYRLLVIVGNTEGNNFSDSDFNITFKEPKYRESPADTASTNKNNISIGLTSPIDIIQEKHGISEDEAKAKYEENIKIRNMANQNLNQPTLDEITTAKAMGIDAPT